MLLTLDIGNTRAKASIFDHGAIIFEDTWRDNDAEHIQSLIEQFNLTHCVYSNVGKERLIIEETLHANGVSILRLTAQTPTPVENPFPTLGADRLAAVVGAVSLSPNQALLVIDAGTCVTYDFVSPEGKLLGGNIAPGLHLRLQSMHDHTALLPQISPFGETPLIGYDTATAMRAGAALGLHFEIEGFIRHFALQHNDLSVYMTGGDQFEMSEDLVNRVTIEPHLVAIGLHRIFQYHQHKHT